MKDLKIFADAWEIDDPIQREAYLEQACGSDQELRAEIEKMLELAGSNGSFMEFATPLESDTAGDSGQTTIRVGTSIGPYKLREKIGEGGMGIVYVAEQMKPVQRRVALKIIKPGMDSRQVLARFEAERQALAMMNHPNIAKVLDVGTTEQGLPYFVMELINGLPINRYCDENHLPIAERLELFHSVCAGVQHAHQKGIIHRDLKPNNILVSQYDGKAIPKVIDFGVAKATGQTLSEHSVYTQLGQIVGTLEYMSPEQAQRNQLDIDTRSDIYSLGVVLYELLTGELPFDKTRLRSAALDELFRIIREEDPPKPSTRVSTSNSKIISAKNRKLEPSKLDKLFRGELDWIVMKAMDKDRQRRYETANGFAADIERFLTDEPVLACPPSNAYRIRLFIRKNKPLVLSTSAIAIILAIASGVSIWQAVVATQANRDVRAANRQLDRALSDLEKEKDLSDRRLHAAEQATNLAQTRLFQANDAVDSMYMGFAEKWLERKLLRADQITFLKKAAKYYELIAGSDPGIGNRYQLGQVRQRLGRIYRILKQFDDAEQMLQESEKDIIAAIQEQPANTEFKSELSKTRRELSSLYQSLGAWAKFKEVADRSVNDCKNWHINDPKNRAFEIDLALAYRSQARSSGDEFHQPLHQKAIQILKKHVDEDPSNRLELARTYQNMILHFNMAGEGSRLEKSPRVMAWSKEAIAQTEQVLDVDPSAQARLLNIYLRNELAISTAASGDTKSALQLSENIIVDLEDMAKVYPEDPEVATMLCIMSINLPTYQFAFMHDGFDISDLTASFEDSVDRLEMYVSRFPQDPQSIDWCIAMVKNLRIYGISSVNEHGKFAVEQSKRISQMIEKGLFAKFPIKSRRLLAICSLNQTQFESVLRHRTGFIDSQEKCLKVTSDPVNGWDDDERLRLRCQAVTTCCNPEYLDVGLAEKICLTVSEESKDPGVRACLGELYFRTGRFEQASDEFVLAMKYLGQESVESVESGEVYGLMAMESFDRVGRMEFELFGKPATVADVFETLKQNWPNDSEGFDPDRQAIAEGVFSYFDSKN